MGPGAPLAAFVLTALAAAAGAAPPAPSGPAPRSSPAAHAAAASSPTAASSSPAAAPSPGAGPVILFLIDNSASLPPLDPDEKRVEALEKMFTFLPGRPYRLILFGGRNEIFVDDPSRYRNNGQWTDFYFALLRAKEVMAEYPPKTEFRLVLLTDAVLDPGPADWADMEVPPGTDLRRYVGEKTVALAGEMGVPLYVILIGDPPNDGMTSKNPERAPGLILDMVKAANGRAASPFAQSMASFFADDGVLLKKFVFRVEPQEGLKRIRPIVTRITAPSRPGVEFQFLSALILPLSLFLFLLLGILVRSFPGAGDREIVELALGAPVHLAADRLHRVEGGWANAGLSLVGDAKEASASLVYQAPAVDLSAAGIDTAGLDPLTGRLLPLGLDDLRRALEQYTVHGTKDEKIYALNLDYMAKNLGAAEAERTLSTPARDRRKVSALEFLRAKAHLVTDEPLRRSLLDPRVTVIRYGRDAERKDLAPGASVRIGPYGFVVDEVAKGGRKDVKVVLRYDRIPSLLGMKTWLPDRFQQAFRFRRSAHRVVG